MRADSLRQRPRLGAPRPYIGVAVAVVAIVAGMLLPPGIVLWSIGGVALFVAAVADPLLPLIALPVLVAFGSLLALPVGGMRVGPTDLCVVALLVGVLPEAERRAAVPLRRARFAPWLAAHWRERRAAVVLIGALVAYLLVIAASFAVAHSKPDALKETLKWGEVLAVVVAAPLALGAGGHDVGRRVLAVVWSLVAVGVAQALLGIAQWALSSGDAGVGGVGLRVFGTFAQPNPYGGYLNLALPLALALAAFGRDARARWLAGGAAVLIGVAEALARSRGAAIGLGVALVVMAVVALRREWLALIVAGAVAVVLALAAATGLLPARLLDLVRGQVPLDDAGLCTGISNANFSTRERAAHWVAGLRMFRAHPVLGVGAGNYDAAYDAYRAPCWPDALGHAHNYFINAAAETGILGLLAFVAVAIAALVVAWRAVRVNRPMRWLGGDLAARVARERWAVALGLLGVVAGVLAHDLTDNLFVHAMELQVALCLGCSLVLRTAQGQGDGDAGGKGVLS